MTSTLYLTCCSTDVRVARALHPQRRPCATVPHTVSRFTSQRMTLGGRHFQTVANASETSRAHRPARRESNTPGGLSSFEESREYVWSLGLKEKSEWWEWERSGQRPFDIPSHPDRVYRDCGWVDWDDWLGVGHGGLHVEEFRPFAEARAYVQSLGLKNIKEWMLWSGSGQRPKDITWAPDHTYKDEWEGWEDWLACGKF